MTIGWEQLEKGEYRMYLVDTTGTHDLGKVRRDGQSWRLVLEDGGNSARRFDSRKKAGEALLETYGKTQEAEPEVRIDKNGAYILVHDPSDCPLEVGMRIPADQVEAGLMMGTFTPRSKIRKGETVFTVYGATGKKQMLRAERC